MLTFAVPGWGLPVSSTARELQQLAATFLRYKHLVAHPASPSVDCVHQLLQDVVTRGGKFFFLYKRPGHRVILNGVGQMMVSPSTIEASLQQSPAGAHWAAPISHIS